MKAVVVFALFLLLPAIGFSQAIQVQEGISYILDGDHLTVTPGEQPEKSSLSSGTRGSGFWDTIDVVGGTDNKSSNKVALAKGNAYRVDIDVYLTQAEFWLEFSTTQTLMFYVFTSPGEFGTYNKIFESSKVVTGTGATWYSSGAISVPMPKDNHYIIAVSWDGTLSYFYNSGDSEFTSFGEHVHGHALGTHPLPQTITSNSNDKAIYHQRLTTESGDFALTADADQISEAVGGTVNFALNADANNANRNYIILGGVTGTAPGTPLPGGLVTLPVNWDVFTSFVLTFLNTPIFNNFMGTLDGLGHGAATFDTLGPIPGTAGVKLYFAFALGPPPAWDFASNSVTIEIVQ
jgi:hypothetical protein